jgi:hypothetical protein
MIRKALQAAAFAACVSGCAAAPQITGRDDFLKEATRTYQGETTERVILAAQRVLDQSDPKYFEFRNTLNGFSGLRHYQVYAVVASATGSDRWDFTAEREPAGIKAAVTITDVGAAQNGYTRTSYDAAMTSIPLFRLFWSRVEYVLGRSDNWQTCDDAVVQFYDTKISADIALGGLCGPTSHGRDNEPPERLPSLLKQPSAGAPAPKAARAKAQTSSN